MGSKAVQRYGTRGWVPQIEADFTRGMVRDIARSNLPAGTVYDAADYLLHQPGVAQKRGGHSYDGSALTGISYIIGLVYYPRPAGEQLLAVTNTGHLFNYSNVDYGALGATFYGRPCVSPGATYVIVPNGTGVNAQKHNGAAITTLDGGTALNHVATYKGRVVGSLAATPERLQFSPTPDVDTTWDTTNSWISCDNPISGIQPLNNTLLVFTQNGLERILGASPPPNSDMDRAPVLGALGCTDVRSIVSVGGAVVYANPVGVFMTNGATPIDLTQQGGIGSYWRSLFSGYVPAAPVPLSTTWTIAAGFFRNFLFVSVLDASRVVQAGLMCYLPTRAWWRVTNMKASCFAGKADGTELWYGDASTNRVVKLSGIFSPAAGNKNDADGAAVTPTIEFRPFGEGPAPKSIGFGRLDYDMRDAASDNPTMAVTTKTGLEADTSSTPSESPLVETTTLDRKRFTINKEAQQVTVALAQTNASSKTELYALEVETRPHPFSNDGV